MPASVRSTARAGGWPKLWMWIALTKRVNRQIRSSISFHDALRVGKLYKSHVVRLLARAALLYNRLKTCATFSMDNAVFHHEQHAFHGGNVVDRVAVYGDDIG
jgi:hypothetical protein